jgi:hypothetical protein
MATRREIFERCADTDWRPAATTDWRNGHRRKNRESRQIPATNFSTKELIGNGDPGAQEGQALKPRGKRWDMRAAAP